MAVQLVEKAGDGMGHNLANRHAAGLGMRPQPLHHILGHFEGDRDGGLDRQGQACPSISCASWR